MNIKITKYEHEFLQEYVRAEILIGSKLYGVDTDKSDTDYLCIYDKPIEWSVIGFNSFPNIHQFQYTDNKKKIDYIYTTEEQFYQNLFSGDSTINSDVCLFSNESLITDTNKLYILRTYKIIKSYLGFAKRDLSKGIRINSMCHASRSLYIANCILNSIIPNLSEIQKIYARLHNNSEEQLLSELNLLKQMENDIRIELKNLFDTKKILLYPDFRLHSKILTNSEYPIDRLIFKLLQSNNTREFKY